MKNETTNPLCKRCLTNIEEVEVEGFDGYCTHCFCAIHPAEVVGCVNLCSDIDTHRTICNGGHSEFPK